MKNFAAVEGRALKRAMKIISAVIERHNTIPILSYAKVELTPTALRITGSDLDMDITAEIDVTEGKGEWSTCISASVLASIARVAGASLVRIEPNDEAVVITVADGAATYDIPILPVTDFPSIGAAFERGELVEAFTNGMLAAMLDKVQWCVSTEETRYYLNGVFWQTGGTGSRMVATDGHRMAICRYSREAAPVAGRIIPRKTVATITNHLAGMDVKIFATSASAAFIDIVAPGITIRSKLIDGTYPDYSRVLPKADNQVYAFDLKREEIVTAIEQATAIGGVGRGQCAIRFQPDGDRLSITRKSPDFGAAFVKTSTAWPKANGTSPDPFGFNSRYLRDVTTRCQGTITMRMVDQGSPFTIHDADPDMTRVLMPMRV